MIRNSLSVVIKLNLEGLCYVTLVSTVKMAELRRNHALKSLRRASIIHCNSCVRVVCRHFKS